MLSKHISIHSLAIFDDEAIFRCAGYMISLRAMMPGPSSSGSPVVLGSTGTHAARAKPMIPQVKTPASDGYFAVIEVEGSYSD
jgi:hypothetical protein